MSDVISTAVHSPRVVTHCSEINQLVRNAHAAGKTIGLVPTMGALHAGHLSLVQASKRECEITVVSIFLNPTQFSSREDLDQYPRSYSADLELLANHGVDYVFAPEREEMYPAEFSTLVSPPDVAKTLEGRCRPKHFRGVATIVLKLIQVIPADTAYVGQKDYQQTLVIRHMVRDLNVPIRIVTCPTIRDDDGLAVSSRNTHLTAGERQQALALSRSLHMASELIEQGQRDAAAVIAKMRQVLSDAGVSRIDYIALVHPQTLAEIRHVNEPTLAAVAAHIGTTRLIDNELIGR